MSLLPDSKKDRSYLRSSNWNLVRLEGDLVDEGVQCTFTADNLVCDNPDLVEVQDGGIRVKTAGFFEIGISGFMNMVKQAVSKSNFKGGRKNVSFHFHTFKILGVEKNHRNP